VLTVRRRDSREESNLIGSFETKYYRNSLPVVAPVEANSNDNTEAPEEVNGNGKCKKD